MAKNVNQSASTVAVFKVTGHGTFNVELWNGDPIPTDLAEDVRNAGFTPIAGGACAFTYDRGDVEEGALLLSQMQIMHLA